MPRWEGPLLLRVVDLAFFGDAAVIEAKDTPAVGRENTRRLRGSVCELEHNRNNNS